jgi:hypothetical protein
MITRDQAAQIATDILRSKSEAGRYEVQYVVTVDEITWRRPHSGYGVDRDILEDSWIAYLHDRTFVGLRSSTVLVLARNDGRLIYFGSAHDEG